MKCCVYENEYLCLKGRVCVLDVCVSVMRGLWYVMCDVVWGECCGVGVRWRCEYMVGMWV